MARADLQTLLNLGSIGALNDGALLDLFENRDRGPWADRAFETLVSRHGGMVLRVARGRLDSEEDARDAFQATFWILAKKSRTIRARDALAGWLFGVASRVAARAHVEATRRRNRERRVAVPVEDSTLDPARLDHDANLAPTIQDEIRRLPEKYRLAVILCDLEGLSYDEAATRLDCPVGTLKARLSRARGRLRTALAEQGFAPPGWESPAPPRQVVVPPSFIQAACRMALSTTLPTGSSAAALGSAPSISSALTLAQGVSRTMLFASIQAWSAVATLALAATVGTLVVTGVGTSQDPGGISSPVGPISELPKRNPPPRRPTNPASIPSAASLPPVYQQALRQAFAAADAISDVPDKVEMLLGLGRSQTRQGDRDGARQTFRKALGVMATGTPRENWTIPHPVFRIAEAQALNGDKTEAHQTFQQAVKVIEALPIDRQNDDYLNATPIQQKVEGRAASRDLVESYRQFLLNDKKNAFGLSLIKIAEITARLGDFGGALEMIRRSPEIEQGEQGDWKPGAFVAVAGALLPDDPPALIDSTLAEARQVLLDHPPKALPDFGVLATLIEIESKLGRFNEAEELGSHFAPTAPKNDFGGVITFNRSMSYCTLAEEENKAGQPDRAKKSAQKAVEWIRDVELPGMKAHPLSRALLEMIKAGAEADAFRLDESLSSDTYLGESSKPIVVELKKQGKEAEARRWLELELSRHKRQLRDALATEPNHVEMTAMRTRGVAQLERLISGTPLTFREIEAMPVADRAQALSELVQDLTQKGQVAEALALVNQVTDPKVRRDIEFLVACYLPAIPKKPDAQSPRSDAAR